MKKIKVLGMGPGHRDYITPRVLEEIESAEIIVAGKRILESIEVNDKRIIYITRDLNVIVDKIKANYKKSTVAILLSGDTGFYSMLKFLKTHFDKGDMEVITGISSMQYMFSKIGETWDDAYITSLHGRELDIVEKVKRHSKVGILTDKKWSPQNIAKELIRSGITNKRIYVGENLSYDDEVITSGTMEEIASREGYKMCVVVIMDE